MDVSCMILNGAVKVQSYPVGDARWRIACRATSRAHSRLDFNWGESKITPNKAYFRVISQNRRGSGRLPDDELRCSIAPAGDASHP
jgi:hypothetical protein